MRKLIIDVEMPLAGEFRQELEVPDPNYLDESVWILANLRGVINAHAVIKSFEIVEA